MPQWQFRVMIALSSVLSLVPLVLCLPLWRYLRVETIQRWRRVLSMIGLGLATAASLVPPLWLFAMVLLSRAEDSHESPMLGIMIEAIVAGLGCVILAAIALCFAKGKVRWMGLTACIVTIALFLLSFLPVMPSSTR